MDAARRETAFEVAGEAGDGFAFRGAVGGGVVAEVDGVAGADEGAAGTTDVGLAENLGLQAGEYVDLDYTYR